MAFFEGLLYYRAGSKVVSDCKVNSNDSAFVIKFLVFYFFLPFFSPSTDNNITIILTLQKWIIVVVHPRDSCSHNKSLDEQTTALINQRYPTQNESEEAGLNESSQEISMTML